MPSTSSPVNLYQEDSFAVDDDNDQYEQSLLYTLDDIEIEQADETVATATTTTKINRRNKYLIYLIVAAISIAIVFSSALLLFFLIRFIIHKRNESSSSSTASKMIRFLVIGDWGRRGDFNQTVVSEQMTQWCRSSNNNNNRQRQHHGCDFVVNVGDNFYQDGVSSVHDPLWQESFEQVYNSRELKQVKWYSVLGNHDYHTNAQAQIDYMQMSTRWYMPHPFYDILYNSSIQNNKKDNDDDNDDDDDDHDHNIKVHMIFTDTTPFISSYYQNDNMNQTFLDMNRLNRTNQMQWISDKVQQYDNNNNNEEEKKKKKRRVVGDDDDDDEHGVHWKFVIGHHPVYSGGNSHGDSPELISQFAPLFDKHAVDAYFCGHDHSTQLLKDSTSSTMYVLSGAGSKVNPVNPHPKMIANDAEAGFVGVTLTKDEMIIEGFNLRGQLRYTYTVSKDD